MPGERQKTIEEQIAELEMEAAEISAGTGAGRRKRLQLEVRIQELRDLDKRKN